MKGWDYWAVKAPVYEAATKEEPFEQERDTKTALSIVSWPESRFTIAFNLAAGRLKGSAGVEARLRPTPLAVPLRATFPMQVPRV